MGLLNGALNSGTLRRKTVKMAKVVKRLTKATRVLTGATISRLLPVYPYRSASGRLRAFHHRRTASDIGVISQVFIHQDYNLQKLARAQEMSALYDAILSRGKTPLIIDAGANIGASVAWFAARFPRARILAFEPEPENFRLLEKNSVGLNAELFQAAIGSAEGTVDLVDAGTGGWGFQTRRSPEGSVKVFSLAKVVQAAQASGSEPFIVKIDIEGGEDDLFKGKTDWIDAFPLIVIELHDWLFPGKASSRNFLKAMANRGRDYVHFGENIFSIRNG